MSSSVSPLAHHVSASPFLYLISSPTSIIPQLSFCNHCSSFHRKHHSSSSLSHHFLSFPARSVFQGAGVCILRACVLLCDRLILTLLISMEMEGRWCIRAAGSGEVTGNTPTVVNWQHVHQTDLNLKPLGLSAARCHQQPVLMHSWHPPHQPLSLWWYLTACASRRVFTNVYSYKHDIIAKVLQNCLSWLRVILFKLQVLLVFFTFRIVNVLFQQQ